MSDDLTLGVRNLLRASLKLVAEKFVDDVKFEFSRYLRRFDFEEFENSVRFSIVPFFDERVGDLHLHELAIEWTGAKRKIRTVQIWLPVCSSDLQQEKVRYGRAEMRFRKAVRKCAWIAMMMTIGFRHEKARD